VASPRPSSRESTVKDRRPLVAVAILSALIVLTACCALLASLTATGILGFGIAFFGLALICIGGLCLRETRRVGRGLRRAGADLSRTRRAHDELLRELALMTKTQETTRSTLRAVKNSTSQQQATLQCIVAGQLEINRVISNGVDPAALSTRLTGQLHQQQAMLNLFTLYGVDDMVPTMGGWAASADVIALLITELLNNRPRLVVECGSGVSTLWMALAIRHHGLDCRIVSLDHDPLFAEETRRNLRKHGVEGIAEVRVAPLTGTGLEGHDTDWYDRTALAGLTDIGLLFVDGPPESTGPLVRYPAVPLMRDLLGPTASVILDDAVRPAEREIVTRWRIHLLDFDYEYVTLDKGAARFRRAPG